MSIHVAKQERVEQLVTERLGSVLKPPLEPNDACVEQLLCQAPRRLTLHAGGWRTSSVDVVLESLGWVAFSGGGEVRLDVYSFGKCYIRDPLMPFEGFTSSRKFTG